MILASGYNGSPARPHLSGRFQNCIGSGDGVVVVGVVGFELCMGVGGGRNMVLRRWCGWTRTGTSALSIEKRYYGTIFPWLDRGTGTRDASLGRETGFEYGVDLGAIASIVTLLLSLTGWLQRARRPWLCLKRNYGMPFVSENPLHLPCYPWLCSSGSWGTRESSLFYTRRRDVFWQAWQAWHAVLSVLGARDPCSRWRRCFSGGEHSICYPIFPSVI